MQLESLQVPLFDAMESIELLSTLSQIPIVPNSDESHQAAQIAKEFEYLPLALEQAAGYVREVVGDFASFLDYYHKNHTDIHC